MNYYTSTPNAPPQALTGLKAMPMNVYGQNFADNYGIDIDRAATDYDIAATKAQDDYQTRRLASQRQAVLAGLQMMADQQKRDQDIGTSKIHSAGQVASLLGGLYR